MNPNKDKVMDLQKAQFLLDSIERDHLGLVIFDQPGVNRGAVSTLLDFHVPVMLEALRSKPDQSDMKNRAHVRKISSARKSVLRKFITEARIALINQNGNYKGLSEDESAAVDSILDTLIEECELVVGK